MKKTRVYLDMDGTIANLYNQKDWLTRLRKEDENIFLECQPMTTEEKLFELFPQDKYIIAILSMTPKGATKEYCENVEQQKNKWLDKHFPNLTKRIYKKYSYNKNVKNSEKAILIDDNKTIRDNFKGLSINPSELW